MNKRTKISAVLLIVFLGIFFWKKGQTEKSDTFLAVAKKRSFPIEVHTTGEVDAGHSTTVSSTLRGDISKLIELIPDGTPVTKGDVIARIDTTPFEEKIQEIGLKIQDQEMKVIALKQTLEREKGLVNHEQECIDYEIESCELEVEKIKNGEGPFEIARLSSQLSKAKLKYEELLSYQGELLDLIKNCDFPPGELVQCQKQLEQEKEAFQLAETQYENFVKFVYPSLLKKAELNLRKVIAKRREVQNVGNYRIATAEIAYEQAVKYLNSLKRQLQASEMELAQTTIVSPSPGIIVHRSEFRTGNKRKPQLGDMLMKNQPLLEIPDLSTMIVHTKIREMDLHKVDIGKKASVEVDAFPGKVFHGEVSYLGTLAQKDMHTGCNEKAFEMTVQLVDKDPRLRPGMTARITVHSDEVMEQLSIPSHSVFIADNTFYCYLETRKGCQKKEISIKPANDQWVLVTEGLDEGDLIFLTPPLD